MGYVNTFGPDFDCITAGGLAELSNLVDEGAQTLIRAGLLADGGWGGAGDGNTYTVTRAGRTALAEGTVAEALGSAPS